VEFSPSNKKRKREEEKAEKKEIAGLLLSA
jgi:hypothetical protein